MLIILTILSCLAVAPTDPLAGPTVAATLPTDSLVRLDYQGRLIRLDQPAPIAALNMLALDDASAIAVNAVIAARAKLLDRPDVRKVPILLDLQAARDNNQPDKIDAALARFERYNRPFAARGSLRDDLAAALPPPHREHFLALVAAYQTALVDDESGPSGDRAAAALLIERNARLDEHQASYDRTLGQRRTDFDALLNTLNLSPEQDASFRGAILRIAESALSQGKPTGRVVLSSVFDIWSTLSWSQRSRLFAELRRRGGRTESRPLREHPQLAISLLGLPIVPFVAPRRRRHKAPALKTAA